MEIETQLQIARNLDYLDGKKTDDLLHECAELGRILNGLMSSLQT